MVGSGILLPERNNQTDVKFKEPFEAYGNKMLILSKLNKECDLFRSKQTEKVRFRVPVTDEKVSIDLKLVTCLGAVKVCKVL